MVIVGRASTGKRPKLKAVLLRIPVNIMQELDMALALGTVAGKRKRDDIPLEKSDRDTCYLPPSRAFFDSLTGASWALYLRSPAPLGAGFLEKVYERALLRELGLRAIQAAAQVPLTVNLRSEEHTSELQSPMYLVCRL